MLPRQTSHLSDDESELKNENSTSSTSDSEDEEINTSEIPDNDSDTEAKPDSPDGDSSEDESPDDDTQVLLTAIKNEDYKLAVHALTKLKPNLNILIPVKRFLFSTGKSFDANYTPLHLAIFKLNHTLVNLLLKHGADLNKKSSVGHTAVELLLVALGERYLGRKEKFTPKFFSKHKINIQFNRTFKLNEDHFTASEDIFDLLLIYGIDRNFSWTEDFSQSMKNLAEAAYFENRAIKNRFLTKAMVQSYENKLKSKSYLALGMYKLIVWSVSPRLPGKALVRAG